MDIKVRSGRVNLVYGGYPWPEGVYHSSICHSFLWGVLINWLVGLSCIYWERTKNVIFGEQIWIWANYGGWRDLSASLINWGSGSNWRRCSPTKPAQRISRCTAMQLITFGTGGGEREGCILLRSILVYLWYLSNFTNTNAHVEEETLSALQCNLSNLEQMGVGRLYIALSVFVYSCICVFFHIMLFEGEPQVALQCSSSHLER